MSTIFMASGKDLTTLYCICRQPYNESEFMIECDICKDWFHGSCVGVQEHLASDIEIYHCPNCQVVHGPLILKERVNWHRHNYAESAGSKAVQTGTVVFIKELKSRQFPSADEIPILRMPSGLVTKSFFDENGMDLPVLVDKKDGLGMTVPSPDFSIQDVENYVGSMRELDVIDVARQEDYKMLMREWTDYYNSTNREKIFNVISLEFSNSKLSDLVVLPSVVRDISWVSNGVWPPRLPSNCTYTRPEVTKYCLMGVRDSYTDFHIDFGGSSVWYHVLRGEKIFYLIQPTSCNLNLYETWLSASNQSELFFGDQVDKCYKCVVKQGQTLFIPTAWIHAVFTPIDTLVFGGNFLHSYNVPLQLECYAIEKRVKTPKKYLFPEYETINWYAASHILDTLRDCVEENKKPPKQVFDAAKALIYHLRNWTQRKDFTKTLKHEGPEHIQYGTILKDLGKHVKSYDETMLSSARKPRGERKKKERKKKNVDKVKKSAAAKNMAEIDLLHQHTESKLHEMEMEQRKNIYNFEDDESDIGNLHMRIPRAAAKSDPSDLESSPEKMGGKTSLTLKVSNGKIVSEKKPKKGEFQPFVSNDNEDSDQEALVVDENPKSTRKKSEKSSQPSLKLKFSITNKPPKDVPVKPELSPDTKPKLPIKSDTNSAKAAAINQLLLSKLTSASPQKPSHNAASPVPVSVGLKSHLTPSKTDLKPSVEHLPLKSDLTLSDIINQSALSGSMGSLTTLGQLDAAGDASELITPEQAMRMNIPTIRGGLNGSIADILEASGYGTETAFTVDDDINRAPSPSMREAIQGMLSMSRGGLVGMQLFSKAESRRLAGQKRSSLAMDDEEEQLSRCYQDDEFVYPTLELDEEETEQLMKAQGKLSRDDTWSPKARVHVTVPHGERPHREGTKKEAVEMCLAASAAKISSSPLKVKRQYKKKLKLDIPTMEVLPGTSSGFVSPSSSGSAFRPGVKPGTSTGSPPKARKPKKGQATAKQRLGKILKIHKISMH